VTVRYFHTTHAADAILRDGFRDNTSNYLMSALTLTGVFIADRPLDANEGAKGDQLLEIELPGDLDLHEYELVEDQKPHRE
jgi:hypothetical protein